MNKPIGALANSLCEVRAPGFAFIVYAVNSFFHEGNVRLKAVATNRLILLQGGSASDRRKSASSV